MAVFLGSSCCEPSAKETDLACVAAAMASRANFDTCSVSNSLHTELWPGC